MVNETVLSFSTETLYFLLPVFIVFLTILTKRLIAIIISFYFLAFCFIYLAYSTLSVVYALASVVALAVSITLSFELVSD